MASAPTNKGCPVDGAHNPELLAIPNGSPPGYTFQVRCRTGDFTATAATEIVTAIKNWESGV